MDNKQKMFISVEEMAQQMDIALVNAYALCRKEGFPAVRITPRRIIIPVEALKQWMEKNAGVK